MFIFKIIGKLIWWIVIRPIVIFTLLFAFIGYKICRGIMTLLLRIWYPGMRFGDFGFNDSSYHDTGDE